MQSIWRIFLALLRLLLYTSPVDTVWAVSIIWIARLVTLALLIRTYFAPTVIRVLSKKLRVRSISLRSIRGLYLRTARVVYNVERIKLGWRWVAEDKTVRVRVTVENLSVELLPLSKRKKAKTSQVRRIPTLADLNPSPITPSIHTLLNYIIRPALTAIVRILLRLVIAVLPTLTQILEVELENTKITSRPHAGATIILGTVFLSSHLVFSQPDAKSSMDSISGTTGTHTPALDSTSDRRFVSSLGGERAWANTRAFAKFSLNISEITCFPGEKAAGGPKHDPNGRINSIFAMPRGLLLRLESQFSPSTFELDLRGLSASLDLGSVHINIERLLLLMRSLKRLNDEQEDPADSGDLFSETEAPLSPATQSPRSPGRLRSMGRLSAFRRNISRSDIRTSFKRPTKPWLSFIERISIHVSDITATTIAPLPLRLCIRPIDLLCEASRPDEKTLHRNFLGKFVDYTSDTYSLSLKFDEASVTRMDKPRNNNEPLCFLSLTSFSLSAFSHRWPQAWISSKVTDVTDVNDSVLAARLTLRNIVVSEHIDAFHALLASRSPLPTSPKPVTSSTSKGLVAPNNLPRIELEAHVETVHGHVVLRDHGGDSAGHSITLSISALTFNTSSRFHIHSIGRLSKIGVSATDAPGDPCTYHYTSSFHMGHTFITVGDRHSATLGDIAEHLLLMEPLEASIIGSISGAVSHNHASVVRLDSSTSSVDVMLMTDALSIELWHAGTVDALVQITSAFQNTHHASKPVSTRPLGSLPFGLSAKIGVRRCTVFLTSPDLNPGDHLQLSRGVAARSSLVISYSAVKQASTTHTQQSILRGQLRQNLMLPEERIIQASAAARASKVTNQESAFVQICLRQFAIRAAAATPYAADNPYYEDVDSSHGCTEMVRIPVVTADVTLRSQRTIVAVPDICGIAISIPACKATLQLSDAYHILLAMKRLSALSPVNKPPLTPRTPALRTTSVGCTIVVANMEAFIQLPPKQELYLLSRGLELRLPSSGTRTVHAARLLCHVRPQPSLTVWHEFVRMDDGIVHLPTQPAHPLRLAVNGALRVRIPHGFVLNDLVRSVSVAAKGLKHLSRVVSNGSFSPLGHPSAEGPRTVRLVQIQLRILAFEIADDPIESRLSLLWRAGFGAAKVRMERDEAFMAKVAAINGELEQDASHSNPQAAFYQFDQRHSISVHEARDRLLQVHALDWMERHRTAAEARANAEELFQKEMWGEDVSPSSLSDGEHMASVISIGNEPPLLRFLATDLRIHVSPPSFDVAKLSDFLFERGDGMPRDTVYSLLVPLHLHISVGSVRLSLREYPLPLFNIPKRKDGQGSLNFDTDLVIAEEMGNETSVDWVDCNLVDRDSDIHQSAPFSFKVPKTIMPVKTYADPVIAVHAGGITDFTWGVSYAPVTQDLLRALETFTSGPRDSSPPIGFWDKLRLSTHWRIQMAFDDEVHMHMKGSRDPYDVLGNGAGFALCWSGYPELKIGFSNEEKELLQIKSDEMHIVIPDLDEFGSATSDNPDGAFVVPERAEPRRPHKICAKFGAGVRFGIGVVLERSCGTECNDCTGPAFHRACRFFNFIPHHQVRLEHKVQPPAIKSSADSYNMFRSDYLHLSISLASSLRKSRSQGGFSSCHLSPHAFSHFWSWLRLFDRTLSLPIRQGKKWPMNMKTQSPKLGRHIATIKYRVAVPNLFISHVYMDNSREAWKDGLTPVVGLKANIGYFQADLHQREEESSVPGLRPDTFRLVRRKPFHAAEVVMKEAELRTMLATFSDSLKQAVSLEALSRSNNYRGYEDLPETELDSRWIDSDDFVDIDWTPGKLHKIHLLPTMSCPQSTYFKHAHDAENRVHARISKFGEEDTHMCSLGKEAGAAQVQIDLAKDRIQELRTRLRDVTSHRFNADAELEYAKKIALLEAYVAELQADTLNQDTQSRGSYYMPASAVNPEEWGDFDNVYQVHNPKIFLTDAVRDILMQYYYCSRARRGFEYHMATRAVKFIRDQAAVSLAALQSQKKPLGAMLGVTNPANALRKMLKPDHSPRISVLFADETASRGPSMGSFDPLNGWSDGVSLEKSHFCLLIKPQVVLRSSTSDSSVCLLAATQASAQVFALMDQTNADDPVSGKIMTRSYTTLSGLQMFAPSTTSTREECVPLEVLVDLRCESREFDRLVPQTDASFRYDKFNRLRLRNDVRSTGQTATDNSQDHLHHQTDLIRVHVPNFTVGATDHHLQAMSDVITKLLLFADPAHKAYAERLETMLFRYDFADLLSAANVVTDIQSRLRHVVELERLERRQLLGMGDVGKIEALKLKSQALSLAEELNLIFDAIKSAQDKVDDHRDRKSAVILRASSNEISWRMLDDQRDLLAKLALRNIEFSCLSRADSSTVNKLVLGDLQAFAGSPKAVWAEILSKSEELINHPLVKRECFLLADWTLLAPVGGISIYEHFEVMLHPLRLQIDTKMGVRLMEYVWPERRRRRKEEESRQTTTSELPGRVRRVTEVMPASGPPIKTRTSIDAPRKRSIDSPRKASVDSPRPIEAGRSLEMARLAPPPLRRMATSRSFTDLRSATKELELAPKLDRGFSSYAFTSVPSPGPEGGKNQTTRASGRGDAEEMKSRSAQKSFVLVRVPSLSLLLSVWKEGSFLCQNARIQTRDLEFKNQTWSLEELVEQFIPSDPSWKGWVKMALHQPLIPVLPVARELFTKTKWIARKGGNLLDMHDSSSAESAVDTPKQGRRSFSHRGRPATPSQMPPSASEPAIIRPSSPRLEAPQATKPQGIRRFLRTHKRNADSLEVATTDTPQALEETYFSKQSSP